MQLWQMKVWVRIPYREGGHPFIAHASAHFQILLVTAAAQCWEEKAAPFYGEVFPGKFYGSDHQEVGRNITVRNLQNN